MPSVDLKGADDTQALLQRHRTLNDFSVLFVA